MAKGEKTSSKRRASKKSDELRKSGEFKIPKVKAEPQLDTKAESSKVHLPNPNSMTTQEPSLEKTKENGTKLIPDKPIETPWMPLQNKAQHVPGAQDVTPRKPRPDKTKDNVTKPLPEKMIETPRVPLQNQAQHVPSAQDMTPRKPSTEKTKENGTKLLPDKMTETPRVPLQNQAQQVPSAQDMTTRKPNPDKTKENGTKLLPDKKIETPRVPLQNQAQHVPSAQDMTTRKPSPDKIQENKIKPQQMTFPNNKTVTPPLPTPNKTPAQHGPDIRDKITNGHHQREIQKTAPKPPKTTSTSGIVAVNQHDVQEMDTNGHSSNEGNQNSPQKIQMQDLLDTSMEEWRSLALQKGGETKSENPIQEEQPTNNPTTASTPSLLNYNTEDEPMNSQPHPQTDNMKYNLYLFKADITLITTNEYEEIEKKLLEYQIENNLALAIDKHMRVPRRRAIVIQTQLKEDLERIREAVSCLAPAVRSHCPQLDRENKRLLMTYMPRKLVTMVNKNILIKMLDLSTPAIYKHPEDYCIGAPVKLLNDGRISLLWEFSEQFLTHLQNKGFRICLLGLSLRYFWPDTNTRARVLRDDLENLSVEEL